jgi:threonine/homoserine/homoserine lactone efflux protein
MISSFAIFMFSCFASFAGSLQLGPVNLFVINSTLYKDNKSALAVAVGGSLPEFVYCALAVYCSKYIYKNEYLLFTFKLLFIGLLILIGLIFLFKKKPAVVVSTDKKESLTGKKIIMSGLKGFSLAILNPQLIAFWLFVYLYFNTISFLQIKTLTQTILFIFGAGIGALSLLIALIFLVNKYKAAILTRLNNTYYHKILSMIFFVIAIQQLVLILTSK